MTLDRSRALWNRSTLDLRSEEIVAQILDRGTVEDWRELYRLAQTDAALRARILRVVHHVPLAYGHFWLAALRTLGEAAEFTDDLPRDDGRI